jgi:hypothetical protein
VQKFSVGFSVLKRCSNPRDMIQSHMDSDTTASDLCNTRILQTGSIERFREENTEFLNCSSTCKLMPYQGRP